MTNTVFQLAFCFKNNYSSKVAKIKQLADKRIEISFATITFLTLEGNLNFVQLFFFL